MIEVYEDIRGLTYGFLKQGFENRPQIVFDDNHVAMMDYSKYNYLQNGTRQYNIATIGEYALEQLYLYERTNNINFFYNFLIQVNWLVDKVIVDEKGAYWVLDYSYSNVQPPWVSSLVQGLSISCLIRAYIHTNEAKFFAICSKAVEFYSVPVDKGGFKSTLNGYVMFEEYTNFDVSYNRSAALNGFILSLLGLVDYYRVSKSVETLELLNQGIFSLKKNIKEWQTLGLWSNIYPVRNLGVSSSRDYHVFHCELIYCLSVLLDDKELYRIYKRWLFVNPKILQYLIYKSTKYTSLLVAIIRRLLSILIRRNNENKIK